MSKKKTKRSDAETTNAVIKAAATQQLAQREPVPELPSAAASLLAAIKGQPLLGKPQRLYLAPIPRDVRRFAAVIMSEATRREGGQLVHGFGVNQGDAFCALLDAYEQVHGRSALEHIAQMEN